MQLQVTPESLHKEASLRVEVPFSALVEQKEFMWRTFYIVLSPLHTHTNKCSGFPPTYLLLSKVWNDMRAKCTEIAFIDVFRNYSVFSRAEISEEVLFTECFYCSIQVREVNRNCIAQKYFPIHGPGCLFWIYQECWWCYCTTGFNVESKEHF